MAWLTPWVIPITVATGVVGMAIVFWAAVRAQREAVAHEAAAKVGSGAVVMPCTVCQKELVIYRADMVMISGPEMALVVRGHPGVVGRKLAEYICPYCEAAHCFAVDVKPPSWIGANLYEPEGKGAVCEECRKRLRPPSWQPGEFTGDLKDAPNLHKDYGLVCSRCGSVCCVECVERFTKGADTFACPRCGRRPIDRVFHP